MKLSLSIPGQLYPGLQLPMYTNLLMECKNAIFLSFGYQISKVHKQTLSTYWGSINRMKSSKLGMFSHQTLNGITSYGITNPLAGRYSHRILLHHKPHGLSDVPHVVQVATVLTLEGIRPAILGERLTLVQPYCTGYRAGVLCISSLTGQPQAIKKWGLACATNAEETLLQTLLVLLQQPTMIRGKQGLLVICSCTNLAEIATIAVQWHTLLSKSWGQHGRIKYLMLYDDLRIEWNMLHGYWVQLMACAVLNEECDVICLVCGWPCCHDWYPWSELIWVVTNQPIKFREEGVIRRGQSTHL